MQPSYSSIGQVFSAQMRYVVPLFQRPYVWNKEEQWRPLWDDVSALADRVLNPPGHKPIAGHFLGTLVLEQVQTLTVQLPQRQVIDGQQRLTTLQLLLKAAQHALEAVGSRAEQEEQATFQIAAGQVSQLTSNQFTATAEEQYKVWPTNEDRLSFQAVMGLSLDDTNSTTSSRMLEAYRFFLIEIVGWLDHEETAKRAMAFASALKDHLRIIVLDLDDNDEPQAIFETLNAHGTPLLPADLIKNWLLWQATKRSLDLNTLYNHYWRPFDAEHEYWRKVVGTGHAARPRVDTFLQNWLSLRTKDVVAVKHLYDRFLSYAASLNSQTDYPGVESLMSDVADTAKLYREIDAPQEVNEIHSSLRRLSRLDFVVFRPVVMALLERKESDPTDKLRSIRALESFLVRRIVCGAQTRGYGTLATDLVKIIGAAETLTVIAPTFIASLSGGLGSASEWPSDESFGHNWRTRRFYGWFRRDRVMMMLQALEEHFQRQQSKSEPLLKFDFSLLTIEHIMPQSWAQHWPLPESGSVQLREDAIQNIGNLTLVSGKLNPSLSNSPWVSASGSAKQGELAKHTKLELNKLLLTSNPVYWDEVTIAARANDLFCAACELWPSADAFNGFQELEGGADYAEKGGE